MNEYRIRFINSADETDFDVVVERSEEAAIAAFRKARSKSAGLRWSASTYRQRRTRSGKRWNRSGRC